MYDDRIVGLHQMELQELQSALAASQESFPDNRPIWLKDLASVLNLRLEKVPMIDPVFEDESPGLCLHNNGISK